MRRALCLLAALNLIVFISHVEAQQPRDVSIVQLIASPQQFHGAKVRIIGFVRLEFEGNSIFLHQDDYKYAISKNGLWLSITDEIRKNEKTYSGKYVLVEGTFDARDLGHMSLFSGAIKNITRFQVWAEVKSVVENK